MIRVNLDLDVKSPVKGQPSKELQSATSYGIEAK